MKLEQYLLDKKEEISEAEVIPRDYKVRLSKEYVNVLVGPRRAGKSFLLFDIIKNKMKIPEEDYVYLNFEDPEISVERSILKECINAHISIYGKKPSYIFLDEIQFLSNWERQLSSLHLGKRYKIVVTGSNSRVTSKEIATSMRGRSLSHLILPLSFPEFLRFRYREKLDEFMSSYTEAKMKRRVKEFMEIGGFPQVVLDPKSKSQFYRDYRNVVVYRDIVERYNIRDLKLLMYLMSTIESSVGRPFSVHKVFNEIKSMGIKVSKKTVYNYYAYIMNSMFFFELKKYYPSMREREKALPKVYLCDHGFLEDDGKRFENMVFLELARQLNMEDMFYLSSPASELDVYIPKGMIGIQITLNPKSAVDRELKGFSIKKLRRKYIISLEKFESMDSSIRSLSFLDLVSHRGKYF